MTAEFFRRGVADRIRCVAVAPGYVATPILEGMNQKALSRILENVPIGRLIDPDEVASLVCELYRNEALAGGCVLCTWGAAIRLQRVVRRGEKT